MARNKKVEILSNGQEVLHPITDGDCVIFSDGQTLNQKLSEDDEKKYSPEVTNSSPMFKVGEGNTVDYSANVLDGAYERAVLTGQTYTNNIQEPSADTVTLPTPFTTYERTQHKTLTSSTEGTLGINLVGASYANALQHDSEESYVVLGEDLEFQSKKVEYTNEGQIKSAMLKGQTLVNLQKVNRVEDVSTQSYKDTWQTVITKQQSYNMWRTGDVSLFKPNTKYLCIMEVKENTFTLPASLIIGHDECIFEYIETMNPTNKTEFQPKETGRKITILTTKANFNGATCSQRFATNIDNVKQGEKISFRIMLLEYQEGMENWDIPFFEGMQSVTVSTKLENLCQYYTNTTENPKSGKKFTSDIANSRAIYLTSAGSNMKIKNNTKYLVQFTISNLVLDGLSHIGLTLADSLTNKMFEESVQINANGIYRVVATSTDIADVSAFVIKGVSNQWEGSDSSLRSLTISNIMCIEYQNGMENWDLPYFEDYQVMKPVQVESFNKNIIDFYDSTVTSHGVTATITNGVWKITGTSDSDGGRNATYRYSTILKANKTYVFTLHDLVENKDSVPGIYVSNSTTGTAILKLGLEGGIVKTESNYTPTEDTLVHVWFNRYSGATYDTTFKVMLEESSTPTSYVPHQSKTTYSWDEVILRKIGDIEDTLDLTTGEYVQRIGEIVLDGSEHGYLAGIEDTPNWYYTNGVQDSCGLILRLENNGITNGFGFEETDSHLYSLCDKLPVSTRLNSVLDTVTNVVVCGGINQYASGLSKCYIGLKLQTEKYGNTVEEIKESLKSNPLKILYVMETPIVHKVNLSRPNLQTYDDITHVHTKCLDGTLIPNIYLPAEVSYPVGVEPETVYNVCVNHEVSSSNPLVCNVGGSTFTVTQPRTLVTVPQGTKTISFSGKDNVISEVMMIKNSSLLTRDLPHFNGVSSVQLGKTITNLCGSSAMMVGNANITYTVKNDSIDMTVNNAGSAVWIFPLLTTLKSDKKYFVYAPNTYPGGCASFRGVKNGTLGYGYEATAWTGKKHCIITPKQNVDFPYTHLCVGQHDGFGIATVTLQRPIICEYEPGMENWDWESIGYFTGTKNIGCEFMRVQNKNLFDGELVNGYIDTNNGGRLQWESHFSSKNFIRVYPSLSYKLQRPSIIANDQVYALFEYDKNKQYIGYMYLYDNTITYIPQENVNYIIISGAKNNQTLQALSSSIQIEESSSATSYTAHKENTLYVRKDQPIDLTWEQGNLTSEAGQSYADGIGNTVTYRIRTKLTTLKPNTTYHIKQGNPNYQWYIYVFNQSDIRADATSLGTPTSWANGDFKFTTTKELHKVCIVGRKIDDSALAPTTIHSIVLEEIEEIKLKSASGKYDELDITRGKYIQRVRELYVDGKNIASNNISKVGDAYQPTDTTLNTYDIKCPGAIFSARVHINHFAPRNGATESAGISYESAAIHSANQSCRITISKSKASTLEEFKDWLSKNPLTIVYALNDHSEIEHDVVFIGNKNESGTEITKPNGVFTLPTLYTEQTHIELQNNGLMPKVESRDYIEYPIISAMDRTFTLQHNSIGSSDLTIDLCGKTQTIPYSSPKSLVYSDTENYVNGRLRVGGAGNKISKVMLLDGGYMDRDIPYIEGMKNAVNPIVKNVGKNLFNINDLYPDRATIIGENEFQVTSINLWTYIDIKVKPHTQYRISYEIYRSGGNPGGLNMCVHDGKNTGYLDSMTHIRVISNIPSSYEKRTFTFTSKSDYISLSTLDRNCIKNLIITEINAEDSYEPYKENICYVDCGEIRLTPDMFEQGSIYNSNAYVGKHYNDEKVSATNRIRLKELIKLQTNKQYVFLGSKDYKYSAHFYNSQGLKIDIKHDLLWTGATPFTVPNDAPMCAIYIARQDNSAITVSNVDFNFQLVKVSEIKQLRSLPNGVHDEIDLETGKYIQRVGEVTLNGSEIWTVGYSSWVNKNTFYLNNVAILSQPIKIRKGDNGSGQAYDDSVRCGELQRTYMSRLANNLPAYGICSYFYSGYQRFFVRVPNITTVDELKLWLSQNPITVQYELETPIVKDIVIHNYPHSYKGGHVIIENGDPNTPIPAQITYRAVTNRSGQIQQHTEQVEKQEREINELEMLILANISNQTR